MSPDTTKSLSKEEKQALRHPEKRNRPDKPQPKKPDWIRVKAPQSEGYKETKEIVDKLNLVTVCEEAGCPNIGECWTKSHATFMIMGEICTRACSFCNVRTGKPDKLDQFEPARVGIATQKMGLKHVVITSVDRDDLEDGGAQHFVQTIERIKTLSPDTTVEILTPDFKNMPHETTVDTICSAEHKPDVFNHNLETVPSLYPTIRPGARYFTSLRLLQRVKEVDPMIFTKSGIMVGLGETRDEVIQVMDDLRAAGVDFLTIGQYLQPTPKHAEVKKFVTPEEFEAYEKLAKGKGFLVVASSPLTRSSYHADSDFEKLKKAREEKLKKA